MSACNSTTELTPREARGLAIAATSKVNSLTISSPGQFDLTNNKLIVVGGELGTFNGSTFTGITGLIQSGYHGGLWPRQELVAVKAPVFSMSKLPAVDTYLGPEMKSTGEVMGIDATYEGAMTKALDKSSS